MHPAHAIQSCLIQWIVIIGALLIFMAIPVLYVLYAITEKSLYSSRRWPLPIITDMFGDWPVLSSATMGVGVNMLFTIIAGVALVHINLKELAKTQALIVGLCIAVQASIWIVIPSSVRHGFNSTHIFWLHNMSSLVFMTSVVWLLYVGSATYLYISGTVCKESEKGNGGPSGGSGGFDSGCIKQASPACIARTCSFVALSGEVLATLSIICISIWGSTADVSQYMRQILAISELVIMGSCGVGYTLLIYRCHKLLSSYSSLLKDIERIL
jgi:hypothetical protein